MKKFKSILGGILSLTMLFTLCTPVYASEETLQPEQQEGTDNTDLDYYKQFIPEGATIVGKTIKSINVASTAVIIFLNIFSPLFIK